VLGKSITLTDAQLKSALTPEEAIQQRKEAGGTASASLDAMLADCRQQLNAFREKNQANKTFFEYKRQSLLQRAESYIKT
jgi:hypothetical protein